MANLELLEKKDVEDIFNFMKDAVDRIQHLTYENFMLSEAYMSTQQVMEYTGFGRKWLEAKQHLIGFMQDGKEKRFKRADVDAYMEKNRIHRKDK